LTVISRRPQVSATPLECDPSAIRFAGLSRIGVPKSTMPRIVTDECELDSVSDPGETGIPHTAAQKTPRHVALRRV
jgi:hypothetical protein